MGYSIGDRVRVVSTTLEDGEMFGESGIVIRVNGRFWPVGVRMDNPEKNSIGGFNWFADDEVFASADASEKEQKISLAKALGEVLNRLEEAEFAALDQQDRADMWEESYNELKAQGGNDSTDSDFAALQEIASRLAAEVLDQAQELAKLSEGYEELFDRNEELYAELLKEKAKSLVRN